MKVPHSDFLGTDVPTREFPITVEGVPYILDMSEDDITVLKAICAQDGSGPVLLRALVNGEPIPHEETPAEPETPQTPTVTPAVPVSVDPSLVREWAKTRAEWRGKVKDRGALSPALIAAYVEAHQ